MLISHFPLPLLQKNKFVTFMSHDKFFESICQIKAPVNQETENLRVGYPVFLKTTPENDHRWVS
jgi:hypothetical protein